MEARNENNAGELEVATTFEFTVFYIWGALAVGEVYNGFRTLTYFRGYPFTVGLYNDSPNGAAIIGNDGVATKVVNLGMQGVFDVPLTPDTAKGYYTITDFRGTLTATTFDDTYDLTFRKIGEGTYTEKVTARMKSNRAAFYDELRKYEQDCAFQHVVPYPQKTGGTLV